jgi:hypothetical protein
MRSGNGGWRRTKPVERCGTCRTVLANKQYFERAKLAVEQLQMDRLTLFGLIAVTAMVTFYSLEHRHRGFVLAFAFSCVAGSIYGFLQGAWPFGVVELVWSGIAFRKWMKISNQDTTRE